MCVHVQHQSRPALGQLHRQHIPLCVKSKYDHFGCRLTALFICIIRRSKRSPAVFHCRTDCKLSRSRLLQSGNVFFRQGRILRIQHQTADLFESSLRKKGISSCFNECFSETEYGAYERMHISTSEPSKKGSLFSVDMRQSSFSDALFCSLFKFTSVIYHYLFLLSSTVRI